MDLETLATAMEQAAHELEEKGYEIRSLHLDPVELEDPEHDPGNMLSIYQRLISKLPGRGLRLAELASKVRVIRETAIDVGMANIGILRTEGSERMSLESLGRFVSLDPSLGMSDGAKSLLDKWCETPQIPLHTKFLEKKRKPPRDLAGIPKRTRFSLSQKEIGSSPVPETTSSQTTDGIGLVTMSQPERGRQGTRKSYRTKMRRSGF